MAQAQFHKNQRVYVKPVGTWALVERVVPQWTKGFDSPLRIFYDVGLGREFATEELEGEPTLEQSELDEIEEWRVVRAQNKWQSAAETVNHPYPGTHPVVATGENEWFGWRVPGSEYALSPSRIELQARLIATAPRLAYIVKELAEWARQSPDDVPQALSELVYECSEVANHLDEIAE